MKRKIVGLLNIFSASIIILKIYFTGNSITKDILVPLLKDILNQDIIDKLNMISAQIAIDTALLNVLVNFIFLKLVNIVVVDSKITNKDRTRELIMPAGNRKNLTKKIEVFIKVNYRYLWIKKLLRLMGGMQFYISIPEKINYVVKNKDDFNSDSINDTDKQYEIKVDLNKALDISEVRRDIYVLLEISANPSYVNDYALITKIKYGNGKGIIRSFICSILAGLFFDINMDKHIIRARTMN